MKKKKSRKKLLIGAGVLIVVAVGGVSAFGKMSSGEETVPQVEVVKAEIGDVRQTVEASGTVVSEESKTYFSPVNARVDKVDFKEGDIVKAGTELVAFDRKDLEREEKKAELNVESGKLDMQNTLNKSDKAVQKQKDAQGNAASLKQQVAAQEDYVASLKAQISQVTANAQVQAAAEAADKAAREKAAQEAARQKLQQEYNADLSTYQTRTLPEYQKLFLFRSSFEVSHRLAIRRQKVPMRIVRHRNRQHRCYPITQEKVQQLCRMGQQEQIFRLIPRTVQL